MIIRTISFLKKIFFIGRQIYLLIREFLYVKKPINTKEIPIIINNYNRLYFLNLLLNSLKEKGYNNIYIIDNNSTYPPLLKFYDETSYNVFRLKKNLGYLSLWKSGIYKQFKNQYFVYTDSDVLPNENCPDNFLEYFYHLMQKYPRASKIGFALSIDDLPDHYKNKNKVIAWESQFWTKEIEPNIYRAPIDTTFALYRPNVKGPAYFHDFMLRVGGIYTAKHLPWYNDDNKLSEEELYYISQTQKSTHWTNIQKSNI